MDVHVPLITPFSSTGDVALPELERLAHDVLDQGAAGLVALGTTAEPASLTAAERAAVVDLLAGICQDRAVPLTIGANTAAELRALDRRATAALCLVPPFLRPGEDGVVAWFEALPKDVPLIVYHVPLRTGQELSAATIRRIAAIDGVAALKYAPTTIDADAVDLLTDPPPGCPLLAATDVLLTPMLALGAPGAILASANVAVATSDRLRAALFAEPNPTVIKGVLHAQGRIPTPDVRLPLLPASRASVDAALRHVDRGPAGTPVVSAGQLADAP